MLLGSNVGGPNNAPLEWLAVKPANQLAWVESPNDAPAQHAKRKSRLPARQQNLGTAPTMVIAYPARPTSRDVSWKLSEGAASLGGFLALVFWVFDRRGAERRIHHRGGHQTRLGWDALGLGRT